MRECIDFHTKKAVIIHQDDYSLTRYLYPNKFKDLRATNRDKVTATHIAKGFGIRDRNIIYLTN